MNDMTKEYDLPDYQRILTGKLALLQRHPLADKETETRVAEMFAELGREFLRLHIFHSALTCFKSAYLLIARDAWLLEIASLYKRLNQVDKLATLTKELLCIASPKALYLIATYEGYLGNHKQALTYIKTALSSTHKAPRIKIDLLYLQAQLLEKNGEYPQAFQQFQCANQVLKEHELEQQADIKQRAQAFINFFDKPLQSTGKQHVFSHQASHFIVGFPRSGTTLLDQLLDAHPQINVLEEKDILSPLLEPLDDKALQSAQTCQKVAGRYTSELQRYLGSISPCPVDKLPLHIQYLEQIQCILPQAKVIVMLRDPRDVILSNFSQSYVINASMYWMLDLQTCAQLYSKVMGRYLKVREQLQLSIMEVRYEDLIDDLEGYSRKICEFLGQPWNPSMLRYYQHALTRNIKTPSYSQVVRPIYKTSKAKWRNYKEELKEVETLLEPFTNAFGYK